MASLASLLPMWRSLRPRRPLGARPEEFLFVGDSPADMEAGRRAGVKTCAVRYGYGKDEEMEQVLRPIIDRRSARSGRPFRRVVKPRRSDWRAPAGTQSAGTSRSCAILFCPKPIPGSPHAGGGEAVVGIVLGLYVALGAQVPKGEVQILPWQRHAALQVEERHRGAALVPPAAMVQNGKHTQATVRPRLVPSMKS